MKTFFLSALATVSCFLSLGCGAAPSVPAAVAVPATLTGNWLLTGSRTPPSLPVLSTAFYVNGNTVLGNGNVQIQCAPGVTIGGSVLLFGQIASDGTFRATYSTPSGFPSSIQVTVGGASPTPGNLNQWSGSYDIAASLTPLSGGTPCTFHQTAPITAVPIPQLAGTYSGPASSFGANATFTLQISQGIPTPASPSVSTIDIPLTAKLTVAGSSCFTSGDTSAPITGAFFVPSTLNGDAFTIFLVMNDGSELAMQGYLNDVNASSLHVIASSSLINSAGKCPGILSETTLTHL